MRRTALALAGPRDQRGLALVVVLVLLVAGALGALLSVASAQRYSNETSTERALAEARTALIGRAAADDNRPGSLPCPDTDNDGQAELLVGPNCPSYVGRLPWQTLGLPDLRDGSGERLWYALSPSLRDDDSAQPINSVDTPIQLSVTGNAPASNVAAVVMAPGRALTGQDRSGAGANNIANFLEGENASTGNNVFESGVETATYNDRIITITREQLFDVVEWRVAAEIRNVLEKYYTAFRFYPFANAYTDATFACTEGLTAGRVPNADLSPTYPLSNCTGHADWQPALTPRVSPPPWFALNNWHRLTYYAIAPACTRATLDCTGAGFLSVNGVTNVQSVVIVGGRALGAQIRPCASASDCIEQPNAGIYQYQAQPRSTSFNDRVAIVSP